MKYLVTGITGTLGQAVSKLMLTNGHEIIGVSRDEQKQRLITPHKNLKLYLGDIKDEWRMCDISEGVQGIFHFAALKCVDTLEDQPTEAVDTNVLGTMCIMRCQKYHGISRVILSSTDKASYPINIYGNTKSISEKLVLQNKRNIVCRYGNVLASRGSVIPYFIQTLKSEKTVYLTHEEMSRFFISIDQAARFVCEQATATSYGLKIPEMKGTSMLAVAEAIAFLLKIPHFKVKISGIRPGEKLHECLRMSHEGEEIHSNTAPQYTKDELMDLLEPIVRAI